MRIVFLFVFISSFIVACHPNVTNYPTNNLADSCQTEEYRAQAACTLNVEWEESQPKVHSVSYDSCSVVGGQPNVLKVMGSDVVSINRVEYTRFFECTFDLEQSKMLNYVVRLQR